MCNSIWIVELRQELTAAPIVLIEVRGQIRLSLKLSSVTQAKRLNDPHLVKRVLTTSVVPNQLGTLFICFFRTVRLVQ